MAYNPNRVTIYQVAMEAKVSLATVSRVLNESGLVAADKVKAVQDAIAKLGYVPSTIARGLARSTTPNIAIILPSTNYTYISSMLSGMLDVCKIYGYMPMLFTFENQDDAKVAVENVLSSQAEGIVLFNSDLQASDVNKMYKMSLPLVLIGPDKIGANACVHANYDEIIDETVSRYIKRGLKEINFVKDPNKQWHLINEFEKAVSHTITDEVKYNVISNDLGYGLLYDFFIQKFKKEKPHHEMYITDRDSAATSIINAALDLGYKIPEDLEIFAIIGTKRSISSRPAITSIKVDLYEMGTIAMRMLTKMLNGRLENKVFDFKGQLIKRDTTLD